MRTELLRGSNDLKWDGAYVLGSWFATGESRRYSVKRGTFLSIRPIHKFGAIEFAARWSFLDLNDEGLNGGEEQNVTLGVNWYLNRNVRLMFNTVFVDAKVRTTLTHDGPILFMGRMQIVF